MVREQIKKMFLSYEQCDKKKISKYISIAMLVLIAIIAIILVGLITKRNEDLSFYRESLTYDVSSIDIRPCENEEIYKLVNNYFAARTKLDYPKIFSSFGRDYYKEEREDKTDTFKKTIDNIRYERMFVKNYENIKIYSDKGYRENETICIVTYDMNLGFTNGSTPMIIVFYVENKDGVYTIKNDLDVGTSKYIVDAIETDNVRKIYDEVYDRLNKVLVSSESMRLTYNTLRQFEMNMNTNIGPINKTEIIDSIGVKGLDPIKDADKIYDTIVSAKEEQKTKEALENYLERVIASLSDAQRAW